jgi:Holliday junction resolvase-like predicted endonuclease
MYNYNSLKKKLVITDATVECPVENCRDVVEKIHKGSLLRDSKYFCPIHKIYISPSTFEYESEMDNILWQDNDKKSLLEKIKKFKRESRITRENSEDALTWNIFQYLETKNLIIPLFAEIGINLKKPELIFWSYSKSENGMFSLLKEGCMEFGESNGRTTEPDLIIKDENNIIFIEAKYLSSNKSLDDNAKQEHIKNSKKYQTGGNEWIEKACSDGESAYEIAILQDKYELFRLWIIGTWISDKNNSNFFLLNLVRNDSETTVEQEMNKIIFSSHVRSFKRFTWENIYTFIKKYSNADNDKEIILNYFENKCYRSGIELKKAFNI